MGIRTSTLIDGGYLREILNSKRGHRYYPKPEEVESFCYNGLIKNNEEDLYRIFFYDAKPSGDKNADYFFNMLEKLPFFALRMGRLVNHSKKNGQKNYVQKGVDMKIGIDIASMAFKKLVDRIVIVTNDTDLIPAIKLARINGIQVRTVNLDTIHSLFQAHSDMWECVKISEFFKESIKKGNNPKESK